ncbi:hypothetical protein HWD99_02180 [Microbacterium sp. C5A9]|uniref:hypothetical protein n=1 Tax=Microbacterium sp. C5A9 TaxID=2736663 RepID=UPI001F522FE2|nr:hypothetical protein [Microbacterium sp. C5A9]MCI1017423.1 hypothetical protein [Microbacterium sp. C5A9]
MNTDRGDVARRIEEAILRTQGVRSLYRPGSLITNLVGASAAAVGIVSPTEPLVAVTVAGEGATVDGALGIDYTSPAIDTLRLVRSSIGDALADLGLTATRIGLTIAYVHPRETS